MAVKKVSGVIRDLARDFVRTGTRTNDLPNGISLTTIRNEDEAVSVQHRRHPKMAHTRCVVVHGHAAVQHMAGCHRVVTGLMG